MLYRVDGIAVVADDLGHAGLAELLDLRCK